MNNWEEEFDKLDSICLVCKSGIKQFIQSLLSQREAEIRKETIEAVLPEGMSNAEMYGFNYNDCRQSIIDKAKEKFNINL
jgi:Na+-translocating ferredoxin:NAD+ oxidoreductase RnfG subunit